MRTKEEISEDKKIYYRKHREHILFQRRVYAQHNKESIQNRNRKRYLKDRENVLKDAKVYYHNNRQKVISRSVDYERRRMLVDTNYKLRKRIKARVKLALKRNYKSGSAIRLLGCSIDEFRQHLENRFTDGMSWKNYGEWHIDHIIPCCLYDLTKVNDQKKCFHYTNQQPLWAIDNLKKSNKH
jgi:hypothetical protein